MVVISFVRSVEELKGFPAPAVAVKYYTEGDFYLFGELFQFLPSYFSMHLYYQVLTILTACHLTDEFQTSRPPNSRRPKIGERTTGNTCFTLFTHSPCFKYEHMFHLTCVLGTTLIVIVIPSYYSYSERKLKKLFFYSFQRICMMSLLTLEMTKQSTVRR